MPLPVGPKTTRFFGSGPVIHSVALRRFWLVRWMYPAPRGAEHFNEDVSESQVVVVGVVDKFKCPSTSGDDVKLLELAPG